MRPSIICFSGWGQCRDALEPLAKLIADSPDEEIFHVDYSGFTKIEDVFAVLPKSSPQIVIGWSLGGQIALRAIASGAVSPTLLVLLATPFQFIESDNFPPGMESEKFLRFRQDFIKSPKRALASFSMFSSKGKKTSLKLQQSIENESCNYDKLLLWLDELAHFSSFELDFSRFPKTLGFYGSEDNITSALNGEYFKSKISDSEITIFKDAAHDLHLTHAQEMAAQIIKSLT